MDKLSRIKLLHTAIWALMAGAIFALFWTGWTGRFQAALWFTAIILGECLALALNGGRCPLTNIAARCTEDRSDNFDIYLPAWLARYNKVIFGFLFVLGELIFLLQWARRSGRNPSIGPQSILSAMRYPMPEWIKTLIIALVSSFVTVCLIEPVKAVIQRRMRRREVRRSLYQEMANNYGKLLAQVTMANQHPEMRSGIGERFARGFKKFSFELAQRDPATYYSLGYYELYWIELLYSDMQHIISGDFNDEEQHLRAADFTAHSFLADVKNRNLSRRLVFRVSPDWLRKDIRERLPEVAYTDVQAPSLLERTRRRFDQKAATPAEGTQRRKVK